MGDREASEYGFGDPSFSWDSYEQYRPIYPYSLWSMIMDYHAANGNEAYGSALDLGAGSGIASSTLARHFSNVTLVDPSEHNMAAARSRLNSPAYKSSLPRPCTFNYHVLPAEEPVVEPASQDLVGVFEAIHWTDAEAVMHQIARALKPGGTLVLVYYTMTVQMLDNPEVQKIWDEIWYMRTKEVYGDDGSELEPEHARTLRQGMSGLDHVRLDEKLWASGARRVRFNTRDKGKVATQLADGPGLPCAESQVKPEREKEEVVERAEDWDRVVDADWLREYMKTFQDVRKLSKEFHERLDRKWNEFYAAVEKGGTDSGRMRVTWPASLVMATRK